jgi:Mg2+ and Co2+ transporter CorA
MPFDQLLAAAFGALGTIIVAALGLYGAQRAGIGKTQEKLVSSLKDLVDAQEKKISALQDTNVENNKRITDLESRVQTLSDLTISQAAVIDSLRRRRRSSGVLDKEDG